MGHNATVQIIVYAPNGRARPCRAAMIAFRNGTLSNLINRISTDGRAISSPIHKMSLRYGCPTMTASEFNFGILTDTETLTQWQNNYPLIQRLHCEQQWLWRPHLLPPTSVVKHFRTCGYSALESLRIADCSTYWSAHGCSCTSRRRTPTVFAPKPTQRDHRHDNNSTSLLPPRATMPALPVAHLPALPPSNLQHIQP
jgi:hypothetical protein